MEPSGRTTVIDRIITFDGDLDEAGAGRAVIITTADEIDIGRGDVIVDPGHRMQRGLEVTATLVWMSETDGVIGREYLLQQAGRTSNCRVSEVIGRLDVDTLEWDPTASLRLNEIARVRVRTQTEILFDLYGHNRITGSFILVDRSDNATVAAGMISETGPLEAWDTVPGSTLERQRSSVSVDERAERLGQRPVTVFLTGLTGAGKSTIAAALERELFDRGRTTVRLDGENMRLGVSKDLGFSSRDRSENVRRTAELARLVNDQGLIAIAALVAPNAAVRTRARSLIGAERFVEVFLDPPLEVCRARDRAGLYAAADRGDIRYFPRRVRPLRQTRRRRPGARHLPARRGRVCERHRDLAVRTQLHPARRPATAVTPHPDQTADPDGRPHPDQTADPDGRPHPDQTADPDGRPHPDQTADG